MKENQLSQDKKFRLFSVCNDAGIWAHWNHSFDTHLSYLGPVSCFHILSFLSSGLTVGIGCSLGAGILLLPKFPQSSPAHHCGGCSRWWLWHPCLLIWQEIFHFSVATTNSPVLQMVTLRHLILVSQVHKWRGILSQTVSYSESHQISDFNYFGPDIWGFGVDEI